MSELDDFYEQVMQQTAVKGTGKIYMTTSSAQNMIGTTSSGVTNNSWATTAWPDADKAPDLHLSGMLETVAHRLGVSPIRDQGRVQVNAGSLLTLVLVLEKILDRVKIGLPNDEAKDLISALVDAKDG